MKKQVDPTKLDIPDATMRAGTEGIVITTTSKEAVGKLQAQLKGRAGLRQLQVKRPKENTYNIKVIGIEEEIDAEELPERVVTQNHLNCEPEDITVKKTWKGRRGTTVVFAFNQRGLNAAKERSHLNIGWDRCPVFDHFFLPHCTKCAEHGHNTIACEGPLRCTNCGNGGQIKLT